MRPAPVPVARLSSDTTDLAAAVFAVAARPMNRSADMNRVFLEHLVLIIT